MSINADSPETVATPSKLGNVARLAAWTMRHRRIVLISWVVLLIGVSVAANAVGTRQATNFSLPGTDTQRALDLLQREFPAQAGDTDQIVFRATSGRVDAAGIRAQVSPMLRQVSKVPHVSSVISPFSPAGADAISKDGRIAFATVNFDQRANQLPTSAIDQVISLGQGAAVQRPSGRAGRTGDRDGPAAVVWVHHRDRGAGRHRRAPDHLRLARRDGAADHHRPARTGDRGRADRPRIPGSGHAGLRHRAGGDDRPGGRDRLLPVHRHPIPRELPRRAPSVERGRAGGDGHRRASDRLRRLHGDHRPAGHVRARRQLPLRRRGGGLARRAPDAAGGAHRAAGAAVALRRANRARRSPRPQAAAGGGHGHHADRVLVPLVWIHPASSLAVRRGRGSRSCLSWSPRC